MIEKPQLVVELRGENANIFFIEFHAMMILAERFGKDYALKCNIPMAVKQNAKDYYDAIRIIGKYVEIIPAEDDLQKKYYENKPSKMVDGKYVAGILKKENEGR